MARAAGVEILSELKHSSAYLPSAVLTCGNSVGDHQARGTDKAITDAIGQHAESGARGLATRPGAG
jgi:hypothetical protein